MTKKKPGSILRAAREKAELSQGEVAKKMGYSSPQIVSNWERELCDLPAKKALLFCQITGMSPDAMRAMLSEQAIGKMSARLHLGRPRKKKVTPAPTAEAKK